MIPFGMGPKVKVLIKSIMMARYYSFQGSRIEGN